MRNIQLEFSKQNEFFFSYFRGYSFDFSKPMLPATSSLDYHKILYEAYQSISKNRTAIGTSRDWSGLFSVHLAPPYRLT